MRPARLIWLFAAILMLVPLALFSQTALGESAFSISRSSSDGVTVHFTLPDWKLEQVEQGAHSLQKVSIADANYIFIDEKETLPVFSTMIAIPYSGGATLNLLDSNDLNRNQVTLDFDGELTAERNAGRYDAALYPADQALISSPQVLRDFRVVSVNIYPFQYDQQSKQLTVRQSMDIRIDFNNAPSVNEIVAPTGYSSAFEKIYRGLILNYDQALDRDVSYTSPKMLVIYGNYTDATFLTKVNEYVAWKKQRGFIVNAVSTTTTGTSNTAIKSYIQTQYNSTSTRPDYIVLIGDESGTITVPSYNSYIDYYYTWLAGGDSLGDVVIGRISVETTEQMINYMAKIVSLEQNLDIGTAAWLDKMLLVGDTASSGISTVYTNRYIHDTSLAVNPDYTYTELYGSGPSGTTINAAIGTGTAFYNYRGYIGMSGWPSYISSLNNSYKLFHAVFITCNTGTFYGGTSTTEDVVRKGTASTLGGSITAIGMATSSTHTPMNNCLNVGIFHGIYPLGMRDMGSAMLYGKLYLNAVYGVSHSQQAYDFAGYCNLIGDPTATVYVSIPNTFNITVADSLPAGSSSIEVTVKNSSNIAVAGAAVALTNSSGLQVLGFSGTDGKVLLSFANTTTGSLTLSVNNDDFKTLVKTIPLYTAGGVVYNSITIDDNSTGQSIGNNNGVVNGGETIELYVSLKNTTTATQSISGAVTCTDPYVTLLVYSGITYSSLTSGSTGQNTNAIVFRVAANCPDQHVVVLHENITGTTGSWSVNVPITVRNGNLDLQSYAFIGSTGNIINPGNTYPMTISLTNAGLATLTAVNAKLRSHDIFFSVTDSLGSYGDIAAAATATNSSNTFSVTARNSCVDGMTIPLDLYVYNAAGYSETIPLTVTIGQTTVIDPLGQDSYGYMIFDDGDTGYDQCPTYSWVGIAAAEGGSGTPLTLTDPEQAGDEGDQVGAVAIQTVTLPFTFKYYGVNYTQASICSNGFIAFGSTLDADWRNWRMPDAGGPSPMVAVMWDDLDIGTGSAVYTYYNSTLHYYVVEWYNMKSGYDAVTEETFQAILYDPLYYPTHTNDGQIKLQYKVFNNIDLGNGDSYPHGNYCTVGIEDQTETKGLEYTFNNTYPTAAATIANNRALFITTRPLLPDYPYVALEQVTILDANSNGHLEPGEASNLSIQLRNFGLVDATGVSAHLSSADPYITITTANAAYGDIAAQTNANPLTNYALTVSASCPANYSATFTISITGDDGTWEYNFPLTIYAPILEFGNITISDPTGDYDGFLDPGETATVIIPLTNSGAVASPAGSATLTCITTGITINSGSTTFPAIAAAGTANLTFSITAASSMTIGTVVPIDFRATAGTYTADKSVNTTIGLIMEGFEAGNFSDFPWIQGGTMPWTVDSGTHHSGAYAARSGAIIDSQTSTIETTRILTLSGTVTFWYKVSSEANYDYLRFYIDGVLQYSPGWAGEVDWTQASYTVASGTHVLKWEYMKDGSVSNGSDCAWVDDIVFPASTNPSSFYPPQNLTATPSHQSVYLTWAVPLFGTPTGYKIYRNSALLTTVTGLNYTDLAVTNGTTYSYYLIAAYAGGDSDPTSAVNATPNAVPPTSLTAVAGNTIVNLSWTAASGRGVLGTFSTVDRTISSYKIYRNGSALTTTTGTTYQDTGLTNGLSYSYYVTTIYINPAGESAASNTASATPAILTTVILGTGTSSNGGSSACPINIYYESSHGQSVYTAAELNAAGVYGPITFTQIGFNVTGLPSMAMPNYIVRMVHTTSTDVANWVQATGMTTVYSTASYLPTATGWNMFTLTTPFLWNGTSNIAVDTAFSVIGSWNASGTTEYTDIASGYRYTWNDNADQTNVFTGGNTSSYRPNLKISLQPVTVGALITVSPTTIPFGSVAVNGTSVQQFTVQNTGDQTLTGTITTPAGYTVAALTRDKDSGSGLLQINDTDRNTLSISVTAGTTKTYSLTFAPTANAAYNGNVVVTTNAANIPTVNIAVTGNGVSAIVTVSPTTIPFGNVTVNTTSVQQFTVQNTGNITLTGTITTPTGYTVAFASRTNGTELEVQQINTGDRNTLSISVTAGATNTYNLTFAPTANTIYTGNVVVSTNAINTPIVNIAATGSGISALVTVSPTTIPFGNVTVNTTSVQQFTVQNTGNITLTGTITTPTGYTVAFVSRTDGTGLDALQISNGDRNTLSISVTAGTTKTYSLTFAPITNTSYNGNVVVSTNAINTPTVNIAVTGNGTSAIVTVSPTTIPFGNVTVNTTSVQQFTVQNTGNITLTGTITTPTGYTVAFASRAAGTGLDALQSSNGDRNTLSISVTSGATNTYNLTFAPTANTTYTGNVVVSTNAINTPTVNIAATGSGISALVTVSPTTIPFGNVTINTTSVQQFTVQNTGNITLTGTITTPTGYTVASSTREDGTGLEALPLNPADRNSLGISVTAGQTKTFNLTFAPTALTVYNGNVVVSTNAVNTPTANIAVSGTGTGALVTVNPTSIPFGNVVVNATSIQQFTVQNTGNIALTGTITTPAGYTVALFSREEGTGLTDQQTSSNRNSLSISVSVGQTRTYNLTFAPIAVAAYNGNVVVSTNASNTPTVNILVTGSGYVPPTISLDYNTLDATLAINATGTDTFTISNSGSQNLTYTLTESPAVGWFSAAPGSGTVAGGGNQLITGSFTATGMTPGVYTTTLQVASNDTVHPLLNVAVTLTVTNALPTINLPASFSYDMNGSLVVDFDPFVNDIDPQTLTLGYSGNTNVHVSITGLMVTFTATPGWYGTETLTFSVYDGYAYVYDTVVVTVNMINLPPPEVNVVIQTVTGTSIGWNAVPNATAYQIYRSFDPYGTYTLIGTTTNPNFDDLGLNPMAFYKIVAVNTPPSK